MAGDEEDGEVHERGGASGLGASESLADAFDFSLTDYECVRLVVSKRAELPFTLTSHADAQCRFHVCRPQVQFPGYCIVLEEGKVLFGDNHTPLVFGVRIDISVFDAVPDDYDAARFLFKRLKSYANLSKSLGKRLPAAAIVVNDQAWKLAASYNDRPHREVSCLVPTPSTLR